MENEEKRSEVEAVLRKQKLFLHFFVSLCLCGKIDMRIAG